MGVLFDHLTTLSTLVLAFEKVEENRGGPGVDSQTVDEFGSDLEQSLRLLREELRAGTYSPLPLLRVYVEKIDGRKRPLSIPTVRDRVAQTAAALVLTPILEPEFEEVSYAYRKGRSVEQAIRRILTLRDQGYLWVVDADIQSYFDEIPHDKLMSVLSRYVDDDRIITLVRQWIKIDVQDQDRRFQLTKGIPQGSPLSPLLANLYLDRFDEAHLNRGHRLVRFADDFVVLCKSRPEAEAALEISEEVLGRLQLSLNQDKTRITHFDHGFRYLGTLFLKSLAFRPKYPDWDPTETGKVDGLISNTEKPVSAPTFPGGDTTMAVAMRKALSALPSEEASEKWKRLQEGEREADQVRPTSGYDPVLRTLYLMEQGSELAKEDERFLIRKSGDILREIPALKVDQILIFGNIRITTPAMHFCLIEGIPIFLLSSRGRYFGVIESTATDKVTLHRDQFTKAADPKFVLALSREIVRGKVTNARTLLLRFARRRQDDRIYHVAESLLNVSRNLDKVTTLDELRGMEGNAAARYFEAWPELVGKEWTFGGRKKHPPPDPVNSLLSFGYTLLFYNTYSLIRSLGLHPHVGFYHAHRQNHPALVSDLMEEFRAPVVEATVLAMLHKKQVKMEDFQLPVEPGMPCLLSEEARKKVTRAFEAALNRPVSHPDAGTRCDYRRAIALQVQRLVRVIKGELHAYSPFFIR